MNAGCRFCQMQVRVILLVMGVVMGSLVVCGSALAAGPEAPVTLSPAMSVTATTAVLEGSLNPGGKATAGWFFAYNVGTLCEGGGSTPVQGEVTGTALNERFEATGLEPGRTYTFCLVATNGLGETTQSLNEVMFTTLAAPPLVESESVSAVKADEARLEGVINADNQSSVCSFQYGTEPLLGSDATTMLCEPGALSGVFGGQGVGLNVGGLEAKTKYYYRVVATNATGTGKGTIEHFTTAFPVEAPATGAATNVTASTAVLHGVLNPGSDREAELGTYEFVYAEGVSGCQGGSATSQTVPHGAEKEAVEGEASGLLPGATYTFCLLARDSAGEPVLGPPETFTTEAVAATVGEESFSNVGSSSVTLHAEIDPGGVPTTYFFEYATEAEYKATKTYGFVTSLVNGGHASEAESVSVTVAGLVPETTYHYRVVVSSAKTVGDVYGADQSFPTFPASLVGLPDGRDYELVSSLSDGDGTPLPSVGGGRASAEGNAVTYKGTAPPVGGTGVIPPSNLSGERPEGSNEYLSRRVSSSGWTDADIQPDGLNTARYDGFSNDLSIGILDSSQALTEGAPEGEDVYTRDNSSGGYRLLAANATYEDATPDDSHILLKNSNTGGLYDSTNGELYPVSVLPNGTPAPALVTFGGPAGLLEAGDDLERAVSNDGSRIFWSTMEATTVEIIDRGTVSVNVPTALYVRENDSSVAATTVQLDVSEVPVGEGVKERTERDARSGGGRFWGANSEGSKAFFTDEHQLTNRSTAGPGAPDLYEYDFDKPVGERLIDLTAETEIPGEHADIVGVLGTSEDGSYVYFAAAGALAPDALPTECQEPSESSTGGECDVYVVHEGEAPRLVATVATVDGEGVYASNATVIKQIGVGSYIGDWVSAAGFRSAFVADGGRVLVFESVENLTDFNSRGGREIYLYGFSSGLSCLSCNPSGASSASGGFAEFAHAELPDSASSVFALRDVSANGDRVFFDTNETLVARDIDGEAALPVNTKGLTNVYEYEGDGVGSCVRVKGCLFLLSDGSSSDISVLLDASENGDDVFLESRAQLVSKDHGETFEVYDARIGAPAEPALSECTGTGCQGVPGTPSAFATPSSETFNGVGNWLPPAPASSSVKKVTKKAVKCAKGKKLEHGKCVKVKSKKMKRKAKKARAKRSSSDRGGK